MKWNPIHKLKCGVITLWILHMRFVRAQAINSDIKSWSLKYITKFIEAEKENRVYVEGDKIGKIYFDNEEYWMNKDNGVYKKVGIDSKIDEICSRRDDIYVKVQMVQKLLKITLDDDLYETMVVDEQFNQANFLLSKLVPTTYERLSTMGTATLWKMIMCAWSYKHNLGTLPKKKKKRKVYWWFISIGSSWLF